MHFSIPDTQEFSNDSENSYLGYNIHINGLFHCTVRYKQLHNLHEQLERDCDITLPPFPPKKFLPLTVNQQEDRRLALEKYIQTIGQNTSINNSVLLNGFLLNAQLETYGCKLENDRVDIYLYDDCKIQLNISIAEHSGQVLKKLCQILNLPDEYNRYFSLFIISKGKNGEINIIRKLQNFESPIITQKIIPDTKIILGKWYWDIDYDLQLINNPVALNLLHIQTVSEIKRGWILLSNKIRYQLESMYQCDQKRKYLEIARTAKYYGYIQFASCLCDYPQIGTKVQVAIGSNELSLRMLKGEDDEEEEEEEEEAVFRVTRMRCWRITTLNSGSNKNGEDPDHNLELSFEYLIAKDHLKWITISSEQAILMSICLQSMIDELLLKNVGGIRNQESTEKTWTYVTRDGHSQIQIGFPNFYDPNKFEKKTDSNSYTRGPIMKNISAKIGLVKGSKSGRFVKSSLKIERTACDTMENNAFHVIGDDDL